MLIHTCHHLLCCVDCSFGVERVEDGLDEQCIHSAFDEGLYLFGIGIDEFVKGDASLGRVIHIGTDGTGLPCRAYGACYKARFVGCAHGVCAFTSDACCCTIDVFAQVLASIVSHRYALCVE